MSGGVLVLAQAKPSSNIVINALAAKFGPPTVVFEAPESRALFLKRRLKRLGLAKVADQLAFVAYSKVAGRLSRGRIDEIMRAHGLDERPRANAVHVPSANDPATIELISRIAPDVVVVNGTRILSKALLNAVPAPFINMHAGITPAYRGVHGGYWALAKGDRENCGVTVHLVDPGIDTGGVLHQARIEPTRRDNFFTYPYLQLAAGLPLLVKAVDEALRGSLAPRAGEGPSGLWSHPGALSYLGAWLTRGVN